MRQLLLALAVVVAFGGFADAAAAQKKAKPKPTVNFATDWDAAVSEAKMLNVPIVLHAHGFN